MMDYTIIGTPRCGSSSFVSYLEKKHPGSYIRKYESFYEKTARHEFDTSYKDSIPVVIIRKQADRLNSAYFHAEMYNRATFKEWLMGDWPAYSRYGMGKPIEQCNWTPYLKAFEDLKPEIFKLEDLQKEADFPKLNIDNNKKFKELSEEDRKFINDKLKEMNLDEYGYKTD